MNDPQASPDSPAVALSAGQMLRAAREAKGMHLAVLSVNLKVPVRQLEALEADQHEQLKGVTFVRALAQAVCKQLGADPKPVLAALPQAVHRPVIAPAAIESQHAPVAVQSRGDASGGLSRQVLVLAVLMLLGAAALIWWPSLEREATPVSEEAQPPVAVPLGQASDPVEVTASAPAVQGPASTPAAPEAPVLAASASKTPASTPAAGVAAPASAAASAVRTAALAPASAAASAASAASTAQSEPLLRVRIKADAWVEVRDGRNQLLVKRMVKAGEVLQLSPTPPLFVYLGRADQAELNWRGQSVDLQPHSRNNEARLFLKP